MDYKKTLNLPNTSFPMRGNLPTQEPLRIQRWEANGAYRRMVDAAHGEGRFILHDGPPYANGHIHSGTVLNKILKDFVVKFRNMQGLECEFRPGWDCHGLPIENNVEREEKKSKDQFDIAEFREKCRAYALRFLDIQRNEFKRLGVLGDWEKPYTTLLRTYESTIAREFGKVVGSGALYKRKKPVLWCAHHVTALAEAEVEYQDLSSPSIWVKFEMNDDARSRIPDLPQGKKAFFVIWTTTPWTLPSNLAITLHPELEYSCLDNGSEVYFVASKLSETFCNDCRVPEVVEVARVMGAEMEKSTARHPFIDRDSLVILGDFVTTDAGTGCVHTAPGHGVEDYEAGLNYGLDIYAPVDDKGCFTAEVPEFQGRFVFETDAPILDLLKEKGALLGHRKVQHSYPVCERCKKPVLFRATSQWFIDVDKTGLRQNAKGAIQSVNWIPGRGAQRIGSMVETRPDWCLSRQRIWGLPIVVFYCADCGHPLVEQRIVDHVADIFAQEGADAWYLRPAEELLPEGTACPSCGGAHFTKESDIVDVWFESGVSYAAVIEDMYGKDTVCDLYLEGSDQHRGWFQSTLLESVLTRGRAPYKTVLTHGFVVDGEGKKISKTLGNYIPPEHIINQYGAEIYRLWVAAENYQDDVRISDEVLKTLREAYMKIRNTFRYLLGNLDGFNPDTDMLPAEQMLPVDRFMVIRTGRFIDRMMSAYENYRFHDIFQSVMQFFSVELSAFFLDVLKDRLYVHLDDQVERRSARTALYEVLNSLVRALAPICSFTADEVWEYMGHRTNDPETVFEGRFVLDLVERYGDKGIEEGFEQFLQLREWVNKELETQRTAKVIGHPLDASVTLEVGAESPMAGAIQQFSASLRELFIVSGLNVKAVDGADVVVVVEKSQGIKCERCWHRSETTGTVAEAPTLCRRCADVVAVIGRKDV